MLYDVIIIGSGPAGLTASIYAVRASLKTLVIAGDKPGGQLMLTSLVENFPGFPNGIDGPELMQNMRKQAENLGVEFVDKDVLEIDVKERPFRVYSELPKKTEKIATPPEVDRNDKDGVYLGKSIIIASGADTKWLGVPGEERLIGKGVSSCAPCDAFFFKNKNVVVSGGGDSAMEEALVLSKVAKEVTIIHRRDKFRASKVMQERVFKTANIKVVWDTQVLEVLGEAKVNGLRLKTVNNEQLTDNNNNYSSSEARSSTDSSRPPEAGSNNIVGEWVLPIDGIFVAIGHKPNTEKFVGKIDLDNKGYVKREEQYEDGLLKYWSATSVSGVFVGGDVHDYKYKQAVTAAAFGCMAALDVEKWLMEKSV